MKIQTVKMIEVGDWDKLVSDTYGKPYNFQQQDGCQGRGTVTIEVPDPYAQEGDDYMEEEGLPTIVNDSIQGVKFQTWLDRNPDDDTFGEPYKQSIFWDRSFYPYIGMVINDLHKKGLLEAGDYLINIDW